MKAQSFRTVPIAACLLLLLFAWAAELDAVRVPQNTRSPQQRQPNNSDQPANCPDGKPPAKNSKGTDDCAPNRNAKPNDKPAPLFGGSMTIRKSRQTTDNTALGFNGVDPNGQVQQAFLTASPTEDSTHKAQALATYKPTPAQLAAFEKDGGLPQATPAETTQK
jgi:hypothetical protein